MYTIYSLSGPDGRTRYIGVTSKTEAYVLSHQRSAAKSAKRKTPVNEWVLELGDAVKYEALETVEADKKAERLELWITNARRGGLDLLNLTPEQHAERVRAAMKDPDVKAKISESGKGRVNSPEHRAAISAANRGRVITPEHREIISKTHKGKVTSPETKAKIAEKARGHKRNEGRTHSEEAKLKMSRTRHLKTHEEKGIVKETCRWCKPTT